MNLRKEFNKILDKYGHPVLIVRQEKKLRCSCWNEKTQETDRNCPICFGIGWTPIVEKHTIRTQEVTVPETLPRLTNSGSYGQMAVPSRSYFIRCEANIQPKDLVVDVDWTDTGKPVYNGAGIYEVSHVDETLRLEKGEQVYKRLSCKDTPIQKHIRGIRIAQVNGIINYEIAMGDM